MKPHLMSWCFIQRLASIKKAVTCDAREAPSTALK
jgi:hypothetical protein